MKIIRVWLQDFKLKDLLKITIILSLAFFLFSNFFFCVVTIDGRSMEPTLKNGERGISSKISTFGGSIERFEIIVIKPKDDTQIVKRVVGLPSETIQYREDKLYVNGEFVEESFLEEDFIRKQTLNYQYDFTYDFGPITLGPDEYYVLGDNRVISRDSRTMGSFHKGDIIGRDVMVFFPFDQMRTE